MEPGSSRLPASGHPISQWGEHNVDPLSHLAITRVLLGPSQGVLLASLLPDLPFYATYPAWLVRNGLLQPALTTNIWPTAPAWMYVAHHASHSLPVVGLLMLVHRLRHRAWPPWGAAWALHILVDIPTHSRRNWAPQFLWPLSAFTVDGVSWPEALL